MMLEISSKTFSVHSRYIQYMTPLTLFTVCAHSAITVVIELSFNGRHGPGSHRVHVALESNERSSSRPVNESARAL